MDIARLRALRELSIRQTMAAVAEALHLTPSAVSQQIAQLEDEVGTQLTERQGRRVRLTRAGEVLVAHAERVLNILDEARSDLAAIKKEIAGVVRVAAFPTVAAALLPGAIKSLQRKYPHVEVLFTEQEPADGIAALRSWNVDVAFTDNLPGVLDNRHKNLEQISLIDDVLYVLLPRGHRFASRQSLRTSELKAERWAVDSAANLYGEYILDLCRHAGFEPLVNAECRGFEAVKSLVESGCSISIIPGLRLVRNLPGVRAVKLLPEARRKISIAYRHGERNHPVIKAFVDQIVETAADISAKM